MAGKATKQGVGKLLAAMRKMVREVNDQEICRRLDILMGSEKEDLPGPMVKKILDLPHDFDPKVVPEPYTQYVKHYLYMLKREDRLREKAELIEANSDSTRSSKKPRSKKAGASKKSATPTS